RDDRRDRRPDLLQRAQPLHAVREKEGDVRLEGADRVRCGLDDGGAEGCQALRSLELVQLWYARRVRVQPDAQPRAAARLRGLEFVSESWHSVLLCGAGKETRWQAGQVNPLPPRSARCFSPLQGGDGGAKRRQ